MNTFLPFNKFLATGIGSLPYTDPQKACAVIFSSLKDDILYWPQLPRRDFKENMYVQYSQGLPGVVIDETEKQIHIDTQKDSYNKEVEAAYEYYLADDLDYFAISQDYAAGLYEFVYRLSSIVHRPYIKGQTIGPISFGLTVTDQNKKASIYNQEFCECLVKVLAMKARWQVRKLRGTRNEGRGTRDEGRETRIIIFIDEPYLVSVGSTFFNISADRVVKMLNELIEAIHKEKAIAGIHCCGNTDWGIVLGTNIDILSFDAYNYLETIFLYKKELDNFFERGGILAWGVVVNSPEDGLPGQDTLLKILNPYSFYLHRNGLGIITPSCGLSGVSLKKAEKILELTSKISNALSRL